MLVSKSGCAITNIYLDLFGPSQPCNSIFGSPGNNRPDLHCGRFRRPRKRLNVDSAIRREGYLSVHFPGIFFFHIPCENTLIFGIYISMTQTPTLHVLTSFLISFFYNCPDLFKSTSAHILMCAVAQVTHKNCLCIPTHIHTRLSVFSALTLLIYLLSPSSFSFILSNPQRFGLIFFVLHNSLYSSF